MKISALFAVAAALAGCSTTSGVQPMGGGRFTVTASASPGAGGAGAAKRSSYEQARAACADRPVQVVTENTRAPGVNDGMFTTDLVFECAAR